MPAKRSTGHTSGRPDNSKAVKGDQTRRRILEAAANAFRTNGYVGTPLKDIADALDMQTASLYYHFPSKEALADEVLKIGLTSIEMTTREAVTSMGADATPLIRLRAAIAAHVRTNLAAGAFAAANLRILGQVPSEVRERHKERQRSYAAFWENLLAEGKASGYLRPDLDPAAVRLLLLGAMNWTVEWYQPDGRLSSAEIAGICCEMVLSGLQVRRAMSPDNQAVTAPPARAPEQKVAPASPAGVRRSSTL